MIFLNNIRGVVISYSLVIAVMLLQTPVRNIGTICAVGTMAFTLVCLFLNKNNTKGGFSKEFLFLFLFTLYMLLQASLSSFSHMTDSVKFIVQSIFICFLFRVGLNKNEYRFLMYAYEIFISIWAILIIKSCIDAGPFRYIHSPIDLFGSKIDPNYIGIPLVSASIFLLNDILNVTKKKLLILFIFCFLLNVIAIVQTSSRGNLLSFVLGNGLLFYNYLRHNKNSFTKYIILILVLFGLVYCIKYFSFAFEDNFERMTEINSESGDRLVLWKFSIDLWLTDVLTLFFGCGYGAVAGIGSDALCSHNTYVQLLSETGILGFVLFGFFLWKMFKKSYRYDKVMGLCFAVMLFQIFFLNALDNRCVWGMLGFIAMLPNYKKLNSR